MKKWSGRAATPSPVFRLRRTHGAQGGKSDRLNASRNDPGGVR